MPVRHRVPSTPPSLFDRTPAALPAGEGPVRELVAVREIAHAFLTADRPEEVFQFALERVSPLVGASFASVYLVDGASELMRLVAAYNWPERFRPYRSEMRVRMGFGPSGAAAAERRAVGGPPLFPRAQPEGRQGGALGLGGRR